MEFKENVFENYLKEYFPDLEFDKEEHDGSLHYNAFVSLEELVDLEIFLGIEINEISQVDVKALISIESGLESNMELLNHFNIYTPLKAVIFEDEDEYFLGISLTNLHISDEEDAAELTDFFLDLISEEEIADIIMKIVK